MATTETLTCLRCGATESAATAWQNGWVSQSQGLLQPTATVGSKPVSRVYCPTCSAAVRAR